METEDSRYLFISTGDGEKFLNLGSRFLGREIEIVDKISQANTNLRDKPDEPILILSIKTVD